MSERKPDEKEARREVDTRARNPENRGNAGLSIKPVVRPIEVHHTQLANTERTT